MKPIPAVPKDPKILTKGKQKCDIDQMAKKRPKTPLVLFVADGNVLCFVTLHVVYWNPACRRMIITSFCLFVPAAATATAAGC